MRLFGIILGTLFFVGMTLGTVYFWGLSKIHPKYDHPFLSQKTPWVILPNSWTEELDQNPNAIVWINVSREKNQTLIALSDDKKPESLKTLQEVIDSQGPRKMILNIAINGEDIDRQMLVFIKETGKKSQFLIQSEFDVVIRSMKDQDADHPYGSSQSDRLRFNSFKGMAPWKGGLLTATPFRGDVYMAPLKWKNISLIDQDIQDELHRRQKMTILGPLMTTDDVSQAEKLKPDGFYFGTKESFKFFVQMHPELSESVAH